MHLLGPLLFSWRVLRWAFPLWQDITLMHVSWETHFEAPLSDARGPAVDLGCSVEDDGKVICRGGCPAHWPCDRNINGPAATSALCPWSVTGTHRGISLSLCLQPFTRLLREASPPPHHRPLDHELPPPQLGSCKATVALTSDCCYCCSMAFISHNSLRCSHRGQKV